MIVHAGSRRNGKTTKLLEDAFQLSKFKPVVVVSPTKHMSNYIREYYATLVTARGLNFAISCSDSWVEVYAANLKTVYFVSWDQISDPYFRGKDTYVLVDEMGQILQRQFRMMNQKLMGISVEHCGEEL